ncbi:MAG: carboxymuconolactone decarboxylase family protein [Burkholderiales bacterium]|jgi:uncharacterized peroxidase-related enzyme
MSRLPLHTSESAPEASRALVRRTAETNGFLPNLIGVLAGAPAALQAYLTLGELNAGTSLSFAEREAVQLTAARLNGCEFCAAGHASVSLKRAGLSAATVRALQQGTPTGDARLDAAAAFSAALIGARGDVADAELDAFRRAGFDDRQALEVVLGVALATLCNYANVLARSPVNAELDAFRPNRLAALAEVR